MPGEQPGRAAPPALTRRSSLIASSAAPLVFAVAWLAGLGMLQWSVVRFRVSIVLTLTAVALALAWWVVRQTRVQVPARLAASMLVVASILPWVVPLFSYLENGWLLAARLTVTVTALALAVALALPRLAGWPLLGVAGAGHATLVSLAVLGDPAPRIDVWVILQQASDALARGENFYDMSWSGSPGVSDLFTYLPWTTVLLAPGRWVAGDVRWALGVWMLVLLAGVVALARGARSTPEGFPRRAAVPVALLVTAPGTLTQVDQAWTEPLLAALVVWWAVLVRRGHPWWAVLPLALACASKQHLALLLPVLMLWRPFGVRRAVSTGALTGVLIAPWFLASPSDFVHDTVTMLIGFHPIRFANTWYLVFLNELGVTLPFWVTGVVVLGTLAAAMWMVHRRQPDLAEVLRWCALLLLAANLVNKQAFYNQYWLAFALVAVSLAVPASADVTLGRGRAARPASSR